MTVAEALRSAAARLAEAGVPDPGRDARRLMAHALEVEPDRISLMAPDPLPLEAAERFEALIERRAKREPVSHLVGGRWFRGRWFAVTADTLDPRPETEGLVEAALEAPFGKVLDMGTGTGCILISLLAERPDARGIGTDVSPEALLVAGDNAVAHGVADRIVLPLSEWWDDVGGRYDLIVSNPPYIAAEEMAGLAPELSYEPRAALTDEGDGLSAYRAIAAGALAHLTPRGRLIVEIGPTQAAAVAGIFEAAGLAQIAVRPDLDGRDRIVIGHAPNP